MDEMEKKEELEQAAPETIEEAAEPVEAVEAAEEAAPETAAEEVSGEVTEEQALQKAQQFMQGKQFKQKNLRRAPAAETQTKAYYVFNV
ncbi:MAG: hypothetical protein IJY52_06095, partial [Anaerotignum sp.]|nr:hypothetical protein [Anaerotignum sp.]